MAPPQRRVPGSPVLPHVIATPKQLSDKIKDQLVKDYKKRLKVTTLPTDIQKGIDSAAKVAAQRATQRNIEVEATKTAKEFYQDVSVSKLVSSKLAQAKLGVNAVVQSADLEDILKENARMLRKKWQALKDAGFSEKEAFELIKAEVEGKAARRS